MARRHVCLVSYDTCWIIICIPLHTFSPARKFGRRSCVSWPMEMRSRSVISASRLIRHALNTKAVQTRRPLNCLGRRLFLDRELPSKTRFKICTSKSFDPLKMSSRLETRFPLQNPVTRRREMKICMVAESNANAKPPLIRRLRQEYRSWKCTRRTLRSSISGKILKRLSLSESNPSRLISSKRRPLLRNWCARSPKRSAVFAFWPVHPSLSLSLFIILLAPLLSRVSLFLCFLLAGVGSFPYVLFRCMYLIDDWLLASSWRSVCGAEPARHCKFGTLVLSVSPLDVIIRKPAF